MLKLPHPRKINFGIHEKSCNLSCSKCLVHSPDYPRGKKILKTLDRMNIGNIVKIFDEIKSFKPTVSPSFWSEPLLNKRLFKNFVIEAKKRNIPVSINTNALLIDNSMAEFLVENLDTISVSIDAFTSKTLELTRSTDELDQIKGAIQRLLDKRGGSNKPRIVVSFTVEDENLHEKDVFLKYWIKRVDAVRINEAYDDCKKINTGSERETREPCREIYDSMSVDFNGVARMCCLDAYRETNLGNVFKDGVLNVWNNNKFKKLRHSHEDSSTAIDKFCEGCDQWAGFNIVEEYEKEGLLIRKTKFSSYYNRVDKLSNWKNSRLKTD
jgi:radical SAM protein with 4Fe4S-binding SPASM domain